MFMGGADNCLMEQAASQSEEGRKRSPVRLVFAGLGFVWVATLLGEDQGLAPMWIALFSFLLGASYFGGEAQNKDDRGSFLITGTLAVLTYFIAMIAIVGGACIGQADCSSARVGVNVGLVALALCLGGLTIAEGLRAWRPTPEKTLWANRLAGAGLAIIFIAYRLLVQLG
jgi:hypothetical protein